MGYFGLWVSWQFSTRNGGVKEMKNSEREAVFRYVILIGIGLFLVALTILVFFLIRGIYQEQFFMFCYQKDWKGVHRIPDIVGDYPIEINCSKLWDEKMANGQWAKTCTNNPFSKKPSCHTLCNLYYEKEKGGIC